MIIPRSLKTPCEKQNSSMSRTGKGRTCQTGKQKGLIILLNQGRKISYLIEILGIITHAIFSTENFKEVIEKVTHKKTLLSQEIKNLQIITATMLKIMNVRNR